MNNKNRIKNIIAISLVLIVCIVAGRDFLSMHKIDPILESNESLTEIKMLSDYSPKLKDTPGDTPIYVLKGTEPGGSMLILGGTHPNEISGVLNAIVYIENAQVNAGTLYIIPRANNSGFTHTAPLWGMMDKIKIELGNEEFREFRIGTRLTNPVHQWPDPNYHLGNSGRELVHDEIAEIRNLNRNHPGDIDGTLTERMTYGIRNLINTEKIDVLYDAHEAGPEFLRVNYLIAHENAMQLGSLATMNSNINSLPFNIDISGKTSYGLSHRALGDNTEVLATLFETLNPVMGSKRGKMSRELVVDGKDINYMNLTERGLLNSGELYEDGSPLKQRVAYQSIMSRELMSAFTEFNPDRPIIVSNLPSYDEFMTEGLENILLPLVQK